VLLVLLLLAQAGPARDLNWLALQWSRGDFRAPVVCEIDGVAHRGLRRVLVSPGPRHLDPAVNRLRFYDLEVPPGSRCVTEWGEAPNVIGSLTFLRRGTSRVDTAEHDFRSALRREGGFEYEIPSGRLKVGPSHDPEALHEVDFGGGRLRLTQVERGSDAWRRLAEFTTPVKRQLELEAPDGTRLTFDLVQFEPPR
jgi:hypothetical protein